MSEAFIKDLLEQIQTNPAVAEEFIKGHDSLSRINPEELIKILQKILGEFENAPADQFSSAPADQFSNDDTPSSAPGALSDEDDVCPTPCGGRRAFPKEDFLSRRKSAIPMVDIVVNLVLQNMSGTESK